MDRQLSGKTALVTGSTAGIDHRLSCSLSHAVPRER